MQYTSVRFWQPSIKLLHAGKLLSRNENHNVWIYILELKHSVTLTKVDKAAIPVAQLTWSLHYNPPSFRNNVGDQRRPNGVTADFHFMHICSSKQPQNTNVSINSFNKQAFILETTLFAAMKWI